jgi:sulfonate transport system substrate-binding protein
MKSLIQSLFALLLIVSFGSSAVQAEDKPAVIRLAFPGVGVGNRPFTGGNSVSTLHLRGMLEEEFRADGIKVEWTFLRGAGPATNELYANGLADFSLLGDLPSIVGRASGLKTRILAATSIRQNTYIAVPSDASIQNVKDLRGRRVAFQKGTNIQLAVNKLLEANGLGEKDLKTINMDQATARAAIITKDVDAIVGGPEILALRDQGAARIIYASQGDLKFMRHCSFIGSESFIQKYPSVTKRVVKQLVLAAKWLSEQEANPSPVFQLWAKSGTRFTDYKEDFKGQSLKALASPLVDPYHSSQYKRQISEAKRFGLIKNAFEYEAWPDLHFLQEVLKELQLENYWAPAPALETPRT